MKLIINVETESEDSGITKKSIERDIAENGPDSLEDLINAIMDVIPQECFPPFNVLEIFLNGKSVAHAEK